MKYFRARVAKSKYLVLTPEVLIPLFIIIFTVSLVLFSLYSSYFRIKQITCELDFEPCPESSFLAEIKKQTGINIILFDPLTLKSRLLSADYIIRDVSVTKILPSTLHVSLLSVYPVIALELKNSNNWVVLDEKLRVISLKQQNPNVPSLILSSLPPIQIGAPLNAKELNQALETALLVVHSNVDFLSIEIIGGTTVEMRLKNDLRVLLNTHGDVNKQLELLAAVLTDRNILGKYKLIDVRFSQPVLKQ